MVSWGLPWIPAIVVMAKKKIEGGSLSCIVSESHIDGKRGLLFLFLYVVVPI